jgi:hypothetical protein
MDCFRLVLLSSCSRHWRALRFHTSPYRALDGQFTRPVPSRGCSVTDRVLAFHLFGLCQVGRLRDGGRVGSRQFDHTVGGRNCSRTDFQEGAINVVMYSGAPGILISLALILGPSNRAPLSHSAVEGGRHRPPERPCSLHVRPGECRPRGEIAINRRNFLHLLAGASALPLAPHGERLLRDPTGR